MFSSNFKPPKLRSLGAKETPSTFESWKGNLLYHMTLDPNFVEFIDLTWLKKTESDLRGFEDDIQTDSKGQSVIGKTAVHKAKLLELCLNMIAGYTPISRFTIVRDSTSMKEIFHKIRAHYGFAISGTSIIDIVSVTRDAEDSVEDLYQKILGLVDACLMTSESEISHHGALAQSDEILSPTLENIVTCLWLKTSSTAFFCETNIFNTIKGLYNCHN